MKVSSVMLKKVGISNFNCCVMKLSMLVGNFLLWIVCFVGGGVVVFVFLWFY